VLVVLVDMAPTAAAPAATQLAVLLAELGRYEPALLARPRLVVGSKADAAGPDAAGPDAAGPDAAGPDAAGPDAGEPDAAGPDDCGEPLFDLVISAVTGEGVGELVQRMAALVVGSRRAQHSAPHETGALFLETSGAGTAAGGEEPEAEVPTAGTVVVHRPVPDGVVVERLGPHAWRVEGRDARRAVSLSDLTDDAALAEAVRRLQRLGVDRALARAGARDGDEVSVGVLSFAWFRDQAVAPAEHDARRPRGRRPPGRGGRR
jgi:GTP-binding protein